MISTSGAAVLAAALFAAQLAAQPPMDAAQVRPKPVASADLGAARTAARVFMGCTIGEDYVTCLRRFGLSERREARFRGNLFTPDGTEIPMAYLPPDRAATVRVGGMVDGVYALCTSYLPAGVTPENPSGFQMPTLEVVCFIPFEDDAERDRFMAAFDGHAAELGFVDRAAAGEDCSKYPEFAYRLSHGDRQLVGLFPGYSEGLLDGARTKGLALIMRRG